MAALNFPEATVNGQVFEADTGVIYTYIGTPPFGYWSGFTQDAGSNTLNALYVEKNDKGTKQTITGGGGLDLASTIQLNSLNGSAEFAGNVFSEGAIASTRFDLTTQLAAQETINGETREYALATKDDTSIYKAALDYSGNLALGNDAWRTPNIYLQGDDGSGTFAGDVGIGTTNPTLAPLHINQAAYDFVLNLQQGTSSNAKILFTNTVGNSGATAIEGSPSSADGFLGFTTGGNENVRINSSGYVGIGTVDPQSKLEIVGSANSQSLGVVADAETQLRLQRVGVPTVSYPSAVDFAVSRYAAEQYNGKTQLDINLINGPVNFPDMTVMSMRSNGNVGIGNDNPSTPLDVRGAANLTFPQSPFTLKSYSLNAPAQDVGGGITFGGRYHSNDDSKYADFAIISGVKENNSDVNYGGALTFGTRQNGTGPGVIEKMRISSAGNVGIGTSNPTANLSVANNATFVGQTAQISQYNYATNVGVGSFTSKYSGGYIQLFCPEDHENSNVDNLWSSIQIYNGVGAISTTLYADGHATFGGNIEAPNVTFKLEPDNDDNYVLTTDIEGTETRVYNGPTLDVKERLTKADNALQTLKTAAAAAADFAELKAAIATALADI